MDENFSLARNGSMPSFTTTILPLAESDANSVYSPMSVESNDSTGRRPSSLMVEDANGVFNFQPASMAKAPITKSVSTPPFPTNCKPFTAHRNV